MPDQLVLPSTGRIEPGEVLAENLQVLVAEDLLRARVPGGDTTIRIEHEDGVVAHTFHQRPKARFALPDGFLVAAPLGQVAGDLGKADQLAITVAQRGDDHVRPETCAVLANTPAFVFVAAIAGRAFELACRQA